MGGADTKLAHLLLLLHKHVTFTVVPNVSAQLKETKWRQFLHGLGIRTALIDQLPTRQSGYALALSNQCFFTHGIARRAKECGLNSTLLKQWTQRSASVKLLGRNE